MRPCFAIHQNFPPRNDTMPRLIAAVFLISNLLAATAMQAEDIARRVPLNPIKFEKTDWPWWRGA